MSVTRFAQLDNNNRVIQVIVVDDSHGMDENNNFSEAKAIEYINSELYAGQNLTWKQTWDDGSQRKRMAEVLFTYDEANDWFISPRPYNSWSLNSEGDWEAPIPYPTQLTYEFNGATVHYEIDWNEENQRWDGIKRDVSEGANIVSSHIWNATDLSWEDV